MNPKEEMLVKKENMKGWLTTAFVTLREGPAVRELTSGERLLSCQAEEDIRSLIEHGDGGPRVTMEQAEGLYRMSRRGFDNFLKGLRSIGLEVGE